MSKKYSNCDEKTVYGFGREWEKFKYDPEENQEITDNIYSEYFRIFPFERLKEDFICLDIGCGTGRWASRFAVNQMAELHLLDASDRAIAIARKNLEKVGVNKAKFISS